MWVGNNACYPLSAFDSFILTFQGCLGLSGGMFRVLYERFCSLFYPLIFWIRERCFSLFTCQRFQGSLELSCTFRGGGRVTESLQAGKEQAEGNDRWMSYHILSFLNSPAKVRFLACLLSRLRKQPW